MVKWVKQGRIYNPKVSNPRGLSGSMMPIARVLDDQKGLVRVYFSPRDSFNRGQVWYFDFELGEPSKITNLSSTPLIVPGKLGAFDDAGITLGSVADLGESRLLFYTGWSLTQSVPYNNSIGIGVFKNEDEIARLGDGPVMTRTLHEPYSCSSPFVLFEDGVLKMWYASMDEWHKTRDQVMHRYNIKFATSADGINWVREPRVALDYETLEEYAFGRPFVQKEDGKYKMWYSYRGQHYRIGYAESPDGINWTRLDHLAGISVSNRGWDSEMVEYPYVFSCLGSQYMLYNGNGFGRTGIGLAKLDRECSE